MELPASGPDHHDPDVHPHHKPRQLAKRLETYVSVTMAIVAAALLVGLGYAILGGGPQVPPWMR